jgi:ribosomal protein S20
MMAKGAERVSRLKTILKNYITSVQSGNNIDAADFAKQFTEEAEDFVEWAESRAT